MAAHTTKEFLNKINISESTLRRWLSEKSRIWALDIAKNDRKDASQNEKVLSKLILELHNIKKDWRGWRIWDESHVKAVLTYKSKREIL
jgi:hypothetical protein